MQLQTVIIIILIIALFGGGSFYAYGPKAGLGVPGLLILILLAYYLSNNSH